MEFNELILEDDWWVLRHVINRPDMAGAVILAKFNAGIFSRDQVTELGRIAGYNLTAAPDEFLDEVARGDFSKWEVTE